MPVDVFSVTSRLSIVSSPPTRRWSAGGREPVPLIDLAVVDQAAGALQRHFLVVAGVEHADDLLSMPTEARGSSKSTGQRPASRVFRRCFRFAVASAIEEQAAAGVDCRPQFQCHHLRVDQEIGEGRAGHAGGMLIGEPMQRRRWRWSLEARSAWRRNRCNGRWRRARSRPLSVN